VSASLIEMLLSGFAYVAFSYALGLWVKYLRQKPKGPEGGEGPKETPPTLDLPPGVEWYSDSLNKPKERVPSHLGF